MKTTTDLRLKLHWKTPLRLELADDNTLQHVRLYPLQCAAQNVISGHLTYQGAQAQATFKDQYGNHTELILNEPDAREIIVTFDGEIETLPSGGGVGDGGSALPLWVYQRQTLLTSPGADTAAAVDAAGRRHSDDFEVLRSIMPNAVGPADSESKLNTFIGAARALGFPARYISGFVTEETDRFEAWSEVYVGGIWTGFDIIRIRRPNENYVQLARGLDSREAAKNTGVTSAALQENSVVFAQNQQ